MKKSIIFLVCILMISFSVQLMAADSITIVDQRGKEVTINRPVERIVTFPIPSPAILFTLDASDDRIVGMHPKSLQAVKDGILGEIAPDLKEVESGYVKSGFAPNVEEVLKLKPDVVFQWAHLGEEVIQPLENTGIPVVGLKYGSQEDLETWLKMFGRILGKEDKALSLINYHQKSLEKLKNISIQIKTKDKPRVLYLPYGEQLYTTGINTYNQNYFEWTGAINVARNIKGWQIVNMEQIIAWNPDIIYIGNFSDLKPEAILNNNIEGQDWSSIKAVREKRVYKVPLGGYRWDPPNQESPLMWEWLAEIQHPDLFEYDLRSDIRSFYKKFYNYNLTREQISNILHDELNDYSDSGI